MGSHFCKDFFFPVMFGLNLMRDLDRNFATRVSFFVHGRLCVNERKPHFYGKSKHEWNWNFCIERILLISWACRNLEGWRGCWPAPITPPSTVVSLFPSPSSGRTLCPVSPGWSWNPDPGCLAGRPRDMQSGPSCPRWPRSWGGGHPTTDEGGYYLKSILTKVKTVKIFCSR